LSWPNAVEERQAKPLLAIAKTTVQAVRAARGLFGSICNE
jgi:hypothetical protein